MKKCISILLIMIQLMTCLSASAAFDVIKKGAKGDAVKEVQLMLIDQGYLKGKADGNFRQATEKAVKKFQAANGLKQTGIVDEATYSKLAGWDKCTHEFGEYVVVTEETCTVDGEQKTVCSLCGKPEYSAIEAPGHQLVQSADYDARVCTLCGMLEGEIKVGSIVSAEDHSFEVTDVYYTTKVSEKRGRVTTSMQEGSYMVVKLSFTNLATEAFERWNSNRVEDAVLTYDGKYAYEGEHWTVDDIVPLDTKNLYIVYTVPEQLKKNTDKSVVAEFTIDNEYYVVNICKGAITTESASTSASTLNPQVAKGDTRSDGENFSITVQDIYYTTKVSEKRGRVTTSMQEGSYMVVKLSFTNLATAAFERWNSDRVDNIVLTYNDKYEYTGQAWTVDDIVPLDTQNLYIVYTVPEQLKGNTDKSVVAQFTLDGKSFTVEICKGANAPESAAAASTSLGKQVTKGDTRSNGESFRFTVQDAYYTTKVSEKRGRVTTSMQEGSYMVVQLSFTNLAAEAFDRWHSARAENMVLTYNNKYEYKGQAWTVDDIVPLDTQNLYIVYTVPELLKDNNGTPVIAEFTIDDQTFVVDLSNAKIRN